MANGEPPQRGARDVGARRVVDRMGRIAAPLRSAVSSVCSVVPRDAPPPHRAQETRRPNRSTTAVGRPPRAVPVGQTAASSSRSIRRPRGLLAPETADPPTRNTRTERELRNSSLAIGHSPFATRHSPVGVLLHSHLLRPDVEGLAFADVRDARLAGDGDELARQLLPFISSDTP